MTEVQDGPAGGLDDPVEAFVASAAEYDVEATRCSPGEATETIAGVVEPPAVAAPLPFDGVALPDDVTTDPTPADLDAAATGVTGASLAVADYGTLVLPATAGGSEPVSLFVDRHVAVLRECDVVADMPAAFEQLGDELRDGRGSAVLATGPSATADMGALVQGVHGPKDVHVVVVS